MSEAYNLYSLLEKYQIRIPVYQRDYAQGRETAANIREHLLDDIKKNLTKEQPSYDLNFVYGSSNKEIFYPVDGQQRLTSLYLIGWYLENGYAKIHENDPVPPQMPHERLSGLKEFSYMTRDSAIDFFHFLRQEEAKNLFDTLWNGKCSVPEVFNCHWFKEMWQSDPTVLSAVRFLITVALKYKASDLEKIYNNFAKLTFTLLVSEDEKAEEDAAKIYIRMNNRGKDLTEFENLKAILDRICEKYQASGDGGKKSFVENYNLSYEKRLYELIPEKDMTQTPRTLEDRTKEMDAMTFRYLLLIYCIVYRKPVNSGFECKLLTEELYDISISKKDSTETDSSIKARRFIRLMDLFFQYVCFKGVEQTLIPWGIGGVEDMVFLQPSEVAKILYMDKLGDKLTQVELSDFTKVLKWISFDDYTFMGDFYDVVEGWIQCIVNKGSVRMYFQGMTGSDISQDILVLNGWKGDIACKMESLRCICTDYFSANPVITNYDDKKEWLPFLLFVSDFWGKNVYDPKTFQEYEVIYNAFSKKNVPMEIGGLWRAWYAFYICKGSSSQGDNEIQANKHLWCYNNLILDRIITWNGQYPDALLMQLMTAAQNAYMSLYGTLKNGVGNVTTWNEQWVESEVRGLLSGNIQANTWLSYLILNLSNRDELLLKHAVEFDQNKRLVFSENKECSVVVMNTLMKSQNQLVKGACDENFLHYNQEFGMLEEEKFYNWGPRTTVSAESATVQFSFDRDKTYAHSSGDATLVHHGIISKPMKLKSTIKFTIDKGIFPASMGTIFCMNWRSDPSGSFLYLVAGGDDYCHPDLYLWTINVTKIAQGISGKLKAKERSFVLIKSKFDNNDYDSALEIEMTNACDDPSNPGTKLQFNKNHFSWTCNEAYSFNTQMLTNISGQTGLIPTKIKL